MGGGGRKPKQAQEKQVEGDPPKAPRPLSNNSKNRIVTLLARRAQSYGLRRGRRRYAHRRRAYCPCGWAQFGIEEVSNLHPPGPSPRCRYGHDADLIPASSKIAAVTTKERLHQIVEELSEAEAGATLEFIASRSDHMANEGPPEMLPLPDAWQRLPSGAPAPNWVAGLDEVRSGR